MIRSSTVNIQRNSDTSGCPIVCPFVSFVNILMVCTVLDDHVDGMLRKEYHYIAAIVLECVFFQHGYHMFVL